jgi:two-component system chemotaxis response regulator CheB
MGSDGAQGLLALRRAKAQTFAQDQASSVIYGMPAQAWELGAAQEQVSLDGMTERLLASVGTSSATTPLAGATAPQTV